MNDRHFAWIDAAQASQLLGVSRTTLYAYVSRGFVRSQASPGSTRERTYSRDDVESVRQQLVGPGWSPLAQVHRRESHEHVDVFLNMSGDKILGLAVIASEPRSFTIVNVVGNIDIDKLAKLEGQFGIPRVTHSEP